MQYSHCWTKFRDHSMKFLTPLLPLIATCEDSSAKSVGYTTGIQTLARKPKFFESHLVLYNHSGNKNIVCTTTYVKICTFAFTVCTVIVPSSHTIVTASTTIPVAIKVIVFIITILIIGKCRNSTASSAHSRRSQWKVQRFRLAIEKRCTVRKNFAQISSRIWGNPSLCHGRDSKYHGNNPKN